MNLWIICSTRGPPMSSLLPKVLRGWPQPQGLLPLERLKGRCVASSAYGTSLQGAPPAAAAAAATASAAPKLDMGCFKPRFFSSSSGLPQGAPCEAGRSRIRNIGISAHIDSGKTTLTERILFYTGRIAEIHEVRGSDGVGAKMDSMELEREKGITIQSAASYCSWELPDEPSGAPSGEPLGVGLRGSYTVNLIDTPGHVDFTVEVERALRVLDGAVLVVCGVAGVQSQTLTVDRQMRRYGVPRLIFVNKLDRDGADPWRALVGIRKQLGINAFPLQVPIGTEGKHQGVVDLVTFEAVYFRGEKGQQVERTLDIPSPLLQEARQRRSELIEALAEKDEALAEVYIELGDNVQPADLHQAIRRQTLKHAFVPLLMGSAKGNKGVQPLLDAVCRYLPAPHDRLQVAKDLERGEEEVELSCDPKKPLVAMAFKIQELPVGQLTYLRLYQGSLRKGDSVVDLSSGKKQQVKRLLRMHADEAREVQQATAGDIVAAGGLFCHSGVTLTDGRTQLALNSMHVAEPVVSLAVRVQKKDHQSKFSKALNRFQREDPTFRVAQDKESQETIISGMGELHLDIYLQRMRREYGLEVAAGRPAVNYRESPTQRALFDFTHKKQTGGAGQFARISGYFEPLQQQTDLTDPNKPNVFVNEVVGNEIPPNFITSIERGFLEAAQRGPLLGAPMVNTRFVLQGGKAHDVDSSDLAFRLAAAGALRTFAAESLPVVLEPLMVVEVRVPREMQSAALMLLNRREGNVSSCTLEGESVCVSARVPLRCMFGFISDLRAQTQGQGEFSMTFEAYQQMQHAQQQALLQQQQQQQRQQK